MKTRKIFYYEIDVYPEFELTCNENSSTHFSEVSEEDYKFILQAKDSWNRARGILFKTKRRKGKIKF